jgi:hypothetical protein
VLGTVLGMFEGGATHVGVATDHVIESFRNQLWPGYKTGDGVDPALKAQFEPLEDALRALGVVVWPMVELEADDALASAAHLAGQDEQIHEARRRRGHAVQGGRPAVGVEARLGRVQPGRRDRGPAAPRGSRACPLTAARY